MSVAENSYRVSFDFQSVDMVRVEIVCTGCDLQNLVKATFRLCLLVRSFPRAKTISIIVCCQTANRQTGSSE